MHAKWLHVAWAAESTSDERQRQFADVLPAPAPHHLYSKSSTDGFGFRRMVKEEQLTVRDLSSSTLMSRHVSTWGIALTSMFGWPYVTLSIWAGCTHTAAVKIVVKLIKVFDIVHF